jgi:hypothetical protein
LSAAIVRRIHGILRRSLARGAKWGMDRYQPGGSDEPPRVPQPEIMPPSRADLAAVLKRGRTHRRSWPASSGSPRRPEQGVRSSWHCAARLRPRRRHQTDPLYRGRRHLVMARERLSVDRHEKLLGLLAAGDPRLDVWFAWNAKEVVRQICNHRRAAGQQPRQASQAGQVGGVRVPPLPALENSVTALRRGTELNPLPTITPR